MDRIAEELLRRGYQVTPKSLYRGDNYSGNHVQLERAEIAYRIEADDRTVTIPWYQANGADRGLRNSFEAFEWFLSFLARPEFSLDEVRGLIRAPSGPHIAPRLSTERIAQFYKRVLGGRTLRWDGGEEWLVLALKDFKSRREVRRAARQA